MYKLVDKLENLTPYQPLSGDYKIRLDANESFIKLPRETILKAIKPVCLNRYPDPYAQDVIEKYATFYKINPRYITAGNGSDELIGIITSSFLEKGSKVLVFEPDFSMYKFYSYINELDIRVMNKNKKLEINLDKAIELINSEDIKCVFLSNPCNPTGKGICREEIVKLITSVKALVVLDEAYMDFWNESLVEYAHLYENLIILRTCSKALSMAGIRLGFAVACERITVAMKAAKSPYNVNVLSQNIASAILSNVPDVVNGILIIKESRDSLYNQLVELDLDVFDTIYPTCANFVFIKSSESENVYNYLLNRSIAIRLMGEYLRISCGTRGENSILISALKDYRRGK